MKKLVANGKAYNEKLDLEIGGGFANLIFR